MEAMLMRTRRTLDVVAEARRRLPRDMAGAKERLRRVEEHYERNIAVMEAVLASFETRRGQTRRRSR
jgi:hypothetical protein